MPSSTTQQGEVELRAGELASSTNKDDANVQEKTLLDPKPVDYYAELTLLATEPITVNSDTDTVKHCLDFINFQCRYEYKGADINEEKNRRAFQLVNAGKHILLDAEKKRKYDLELQKALGGAGDAGNEQDLSSISEEFWFHVDKVYGEEPTSVPPHDKYDDYRAPAKPKPKPKRAAPKKNNVMVSDPDRYVLMLSRVQSKSTKQTKVVEKKNDKEDIKQGKGAQTKQNKRHNKDWKKSDSKSSSASSSSSSEKRKNYEYYQGAAGDSSEQPKNLLKADLFDADEAEGFVTENLLPLDEDSSSMFGTSTGFAIDEKSIGSKIFGKNNNKTKTKDEKRDGKDFLASSSSFAKMNTSSATAALLQDLGRGSKQQKSCAGGSSSSASSASVALLMKKGNKQQGSGRTKQLEQDKNNPPGWTSKGNKGSVQQQEVQLSRRDTRTNTDADEDHVEKDHQEGPLGEDQLNVLIPVDDDAFDDQMYLRKKRKLDEEHYTTGSKGEFTIA
ncbi:unnamed protein product, partial [Amoebophrya sp. A120]|eukprot:GSA120T00016244001.1